MSILDKFLKKKGIKDPSDLSEEEKATYEGWKKILSKEELTTGDIREFCQTQIDMIENKWTDLEKDNSKKAELIPYHTVYRLLLSVINSPKVEREQLENQLEALLK